MKRISDSDFASKNAMDKSIKIYIKIHLLKGKYHLNFMRAAP